MAIGSPPKKNEAEQRQAETIASYDELVAALVRIELGDGEPPPDEQTESILVAAAKSIDQLSGDVEHLVETERLRQLAASAPTRRAEMQDIIRETEKLNLDFIAEQRQLLERYRPRQEELQRRLVTANDAANKAQAAWRDLENVLEKTERERELLAAQTRLAAERASLVTQHRHNGHHPARFETYTSTPELAATYEEEVLVGEMKKLEAELRGPDCTGVRAKQIGRRMETLKPVCKHLERAHGFKLRTEELDRQLSDVAGELKRIVAERTRPKWDVGETAPPDDNELAELLSSKRRRTLVRTGA